MALSTGAYSMLLAAFVQGALTFALLVATGLSRIAAIKSRDVRISDVALGQSNWPERPQKFSRAYMNQFELPVLFYAGVGFAILLGATGELSLALAWAFVASRIAHAAIHVTSNHVPHRFRAFQIGFFILVAFWLILGWHIVAGLVA